MSLEAVARLEDRRVGKRVVDLEDALIRAVVEAAIRANWAVDAMYEPAARSRKPLQPRKVEVERVEQADGGCARDAVHLDVESAPAKLARQRAQELASSTGRWRQ